MTADKQLKAYIDRVLRLKEEQDTLSDDIREVYAEAKGEGYDKTIMGKLVAHLRKVAKSGADAVDEAESIFDTYLSAYHRASGTLVATHTHEEDYDRETGEVFEGRVRTDGEAIDFGTIKLMHEQLDAANRSDAGLDIVHKHEEITTAPETANETPKQVYGDSVDRATAPPSQSVDIPAGGEKHQEADGSNDQCPAASHSEKATVATQGEATAPTSDERVSLPVDDRSDAAANAGGDDVDGGAERATHLVTGEGAAKTALPANPAERPKSALRPHCKNPGDNCGGFGSTHCHNCLKARQEEAA